jgi:mRNA interferase RelE/StbE
VGQPPTHRLLIAPSAARALTDRLPEVVAAAVMQFLTGDLIHAPRRVGKPLQRELAGIWSARRGTYRVLYEIDDEVGVVRVVHIGHRGDVYRKR